jgi:hypothetical protein
LPKIRASGAVGGEVRRQHGIGGVNVLFSKRLSQLNDTLVPLVSFMQQGNPVERIGKQVSHAGRFGVP